MIRILSLILFFVTSQLLHSQNQKGNGDKVIYRKLKTEDLQNINEVYHYNGKPYTGMSYDNFPKGNRMQEMNWVDGLLDGTKTEFFSNGAVRTILNFKEGKRHGEFIYYHDNGQLKLTGNYNMDLLDGEVKSYYNNGKIKHLQNYKDGIRVGESILYYKNGNIEQYCVLKDEKPDGVMKTYYWAGNPRLEATYSNGLRNGLSINYHLTGMVAERAYYKDGFKDSICKYYDNVFGLLVKEEYYRKGLKNGVQVNYSDLGDTISIYHFKNDTLHGDYRIYYSGNKNFGDPKNGKKKKFSFKKYDVRYIHGLEEYGSFVDGLKDGIFVTGLVNRENHVEGEFSMGTMVGEWKYFNEKDKLVLHEKYNDQGELIYQKPKLKSSEENDEESENEED